MIIEIIFFVFQNCPPLIGSGEYAVVCSDAGLAGPALPERRVRRRGHRLGRLSGDCPPLAHSRANHLRQILLHLFNPLDHPPCLNLDLKVLNPQLNSENICQLVCASKLQTPGCSFTSCDTTDLFRVDWGFNLLTSM